MSSILWETYIKFGLPTLHSVYIGYVWFASFPGGGVIQLVTQSVDFLPQLLNDVGVLGDMESHVSNISPNLESYRSLGILLNDVKKL